MFFLLVRVSILLSLWSFIRLSPYVSVKFLKNKGLKTGVVTNADIRISPLFLMLKLVIWANLFEESVIADLDLSSHLDIIVISEEEGIEKPDKRIWERTCSYVDVQLPEACHIGDELIWSVLSLFHINFHCLNEMSSDYHGAKNAGLRSFLVRRSGSEGEGERKDPDEDLSDVEIIQTFSELRERI